MFIPRSIKPSLKKDQLQTCIFLSLFEKHELFVTFSERKMTVQSACEDCAWAAGMQLARLLLLGADRSFITGAGTR